MTINRDGVIYYVSEFDYVVINCSEPNDLIPKFYTIFVYDIFGNQYRFAKLYDFVFFRLSIRELLRQGVKLKNVISYDIKDLISELDPFPVIQDGGVRVDSQSIKEI